jgi:aflatoxin B1 aldehyde reductase
MVKSIYGAGPLFPGQPFATPEGLTRLIDLLQANGISKLNAAQTYGGGQTESFLGRCGAGRRMGIDTKHCGGWIPGQSSAEDVVRQGKDSLKKLNMSKVSSTTSHLPLHLETNFPRLTSFTFMPLTAALLSKRHFTESTSCMN